MKKTVSILLLVCLLVCSCAFADAEPDAACEEHSWVYVSSYSTTCFVTVKNNSAAPVSVSGRCTALDSEGTVLGTATMNIRVIGPSEESIGVFRFEGITDAEKLEYELAYETPTVSSILSSLLVDSHGNTEGVTVLVTNTASVPASGPLIYCLFFDENDALVSYAYSYLTDYDEELKPGVTLAEQLNSAAAFDHFRLYMSAYAGIGQIAPVTPRVSEADFSFKEYAEATPFDTTYYVAVKSSASVPVGIRANAIAYDADNNVLGAANALIDVLAPGEETVTVFTFYFVTGCDHIRYRLFFDERPRVRSAISDMETRISYSGEDINVTVTNTGEKPIRYANLTALFTDETGAVVSMQMFSCADDEGELKPGVSVTRKITPDVNFESLELYVSGQKD